MKCKYAKILISAGLDGELSERERIDLERHLSLCAGCLEERTKLLAITNSMQLWKDAEPSAWLANNFSARLCDMQTKPEIAKRRSPWMLGTAAAGLVTTALAFFMIMQNQPLPVTEMPSQPQVAKSAPVKSESHTPSAVDVAPAPKTDPVVESKPETPIVVESGPKVVPESKPIVNPIRIQRHSTYVAYLPKHVASASLPVPDRSEYYSGSRSVSISRSGSDMENERRKASALEAQRQQEQTQLRLMTRFFKKNRSLKVDATTVVASNLDGAGVTVDQTLERVRGALRKAADVIAEDAASTSGKSADSNEGKSL